MTRVIAAIDNSEAIRPVLMAADVVAFVYEGDVDALHVTDDPAACERVRVLAGRPVRCIPGDVAATVVREVGADDVAIAVMGARDGHRGTPAGHNALDVARQVDKPLVLVPPEWHRIDATRPLRLLIPLDGTEEASMAVRAVVNRVARTDAELVVLHVFDEATVPRFLDRPEHDLATWAHEFLRRHCDEPGSRLQWRTGPTGAGIASAADAEEVDAVILGWHRVLSAGRADSVREVLARAQVPVVLVPKIAAERALARGSQAPATT